MYIFISYSSIYRDQIAELERDIESLGHEVWFDQELIGGQIWWDEILRNIRKCDFMIFALSSEALQSEPCALEYDYAHRLGKPLLPVMVGEVDDLQGLPNVLAGIQIVNYVSPGERKAYRDLSRAIRDIELKIRETAHPLLPYVIVPEMPYIPLDEIRYELSKGSLDQSQQNRYLKALSRHFILQETSVVEARELLRLLRKHPGVDSRISAEAGYTLRQSLDYIRYLLDLDDLDEFDFQDISVMLNEACSDSSIPEDIFFLLQRTWSHPSLPKELYVNIIMLLIKSVAGADYLAKHTKLTPDTIEMITRMLAESDLPSEDVLRILRELAYRQDSPKGIESTVLEYRASKTREGRMDTLRRQALMQGDRGAWNKWAAENDIWTGFQVGWLLLLSLGIVSGISVNIVFGITDMQGLFAHLKTPSGIPVFAGCILLILLTLTISWSTELHFLIDLLDITVISIGAILVMIIWAEIFTKLLGNSPQGFFFGIASSITAGIISLLFHQTERNKGLIGFVTTFFDVGLGNWIMGSIYGAIIILVLYGLDNCLAYIFVFCLGSISICEFVGLYCGIISVIRETQALK